MTCSSVIAKTRKILPTEWQEFFRSFSQDEKNLSEKNINGKTKPSWNTPLPNANGAFELAQNIAPENKTEQQNKENKIAYTLEQGQQATRDSVRALMMIRAFRIRGHLVANLDPLQLRPKTNHPELDPKTYGFQEQDMNREIFIDNVLGL